MYNRMMDFDVSVLVDRINFSKYRGSDTFLECYNDKTEWTYINDDNETKAGTFVEDQVKFVSFDEQVLDAKIRLTREHGHDIQDSRLHVANKRGDRHDW